MKPKAHFGLQLAVLCLILSVFSTSTYAQILGGSKPGQALPQEVKPSELSGGAYGGDVNLFTGSYQGSYPLGSVSTAGGLSYSLSLSYGSNTTGGTEVPLASGIPYGEGWSLSTPSISISTSAYSTFTHLSDFNAACGGYYSTGNDNSKLYNGFEGNLYWFSPMISIPGVASGRAVYKYSDAEGDHFALNAFKSVEYVDIIKNGNAWTIITVDGTVYEFGLPKLSFRAAANKRNFAYDANNILQPQMSDTIYYGGQVVNGDTVPADTIVLPQDLTKLNWSEASKLMNLIMPKGEFLSWNCTKIWNKNMPKQGIYLEYEEFGQFNYFREYSLDYQQLLATSLHTEFRENYYYPDFDVYTDVILQKVSAIDEFGPAEIIELDHETYAYPGADMLKLGDPGVSRKDSLYNQKTVYQVGDGSQFQDWQRYYHLKAPYAQSNGAGASLYNFNGSNNPYQGFWGGQSWYLFRDLSASSAAVAFDYGYLESPRLGTDGPNYDFKMIPGDVYEVRTKLYSTDGSESAKFCNYDINIATGVNDGMTIHNMGNDLKRVNIDDKDPAMKENVFSTFSNQIKWNTRGDGGNSVVTSNFFSMPNLPDAYDGFQIQVGPANSDNLFTRYTNDTYQSTLGLKHPTANQPYTWNTYANIVGETFNMFGNPGMLKSIEGPGQHFGIGLPWFQTRYLYDWLADADPSANSGIFKHWWNNQTLIDPGATWTNEPTLAGPNDRLEWLKLIRYSKNPWMLKNVRKYVVNGTYDGSGNGLVLVSHVQMEYGRMDDVLIDNQYYGLGDTPVLNYDRKHYAFTLDRIRQIPVDPSNNGWASVSYNVTKVPTTHFGYDKLATWTTFDTTFHTNRGGILLDTIVNQLGGITAINYYPLDSGQTIAIQRNSPYAQFSCGNLGNPTKGLPSAVEVNHAVKSVSIVDTNGLQTRDYNYYSAAYKDKMLYLDGDHFTNSRANISYGFGLTKVTEPLVGTGVRPTSYYTHNVDQNSPLFGSLTEVKQYHDQSTPQRKQEIEYATSLAFENGRDRATGKYKWDYDYADYQGQPMPWDTVFPSMNNFNPAGMGTQLFYELQNGFPAPNGNYRHSWFVKKTKETSTEYDPDACVMEKTWPVAQNPGYFNNQTANDGIGVIWDENTTGFLDSLLANSPLTDSILIKMVDPNQPLSNNVIQTVYQAQPGLSTDVLTAMINRFPVVGESTIEDILLNLDYDLPDPVLQALVSYSSTNQFSTLRNVLLTQNYLADAVLLAAINRNPVVPEQELETILMNRGNLSDVVQQGLINRAIAVDDQVLESVLIGANPFPSDDVLLSMLYRTVPLPVSYGTIKSILTASPYAISDTLDTSLVLRQPALSQYEIRLVQDAQVGKVDYASYQQGILANPAQPQNYANLASNSNESYLLGLLSGNDENLIKSEFINHSPLSETVLQALINRTPQMASGKMQSILQKQPDLSDAVLINFVNSGFLKGNTHNVLATVPHDFTDALLSTILTREPALTSAQVQRILLKQPTLSDAILTPFVDGTYNYANSTIEAVLLKQPSVSESILLDVVRNSSPISNAAMTALFVKQPNYPSESTLLQLISNVPPISAAAAANVLLDSPIKLSDDLLAAIQSFPAPYPTVVEWGNTIKTDGSDTSLTVYCVNNSTTQVLKIENITEYEYFEADYDGTTDAEGYKRLLGDNSTTIDLKFEPSWQLWRTTAYSPQVPDAFNQQEYYYYFDLKNKYYRFGEHPTNTYSILQTTPSDNLNTYHDISYNEPDDTNSTTTDNLRNFAQLNLSRDYNLRTIAFQERHSSKNAVDEKALVRNTYYAWDNDWYNDEVPFDFEVIDINGGPCPPGTPGLPTGLDTAGCTKYKFITPNYFPGVPYGWSVYQVVVPVNIIGYYLCPSGALDISEDSIFLVHSNPGSEVDDYMTQENFVAPEIGEVTFGEGHPMTRQFLYRATYQQVDTLPIGPSDYWNYFDVVDASLMVFKEVPNPHVNNQQNTIFIPQFPYDTLCTHKVLERTPLGQVKLEEDEKDLKTRYYFNKGKYVWYRDTNCRVNSYSASIIDNVRTPFKVVEGVGLTDSLQMQFKYNTDLSIDSLISQSGVVMHNHYDESGRLRSRYRNGIRLDSINYFTWDNSASSFLKKAEQNFIETFIFIDDSSSQAEHGRAWIDAMGRTFHSATQISPNADLGALGTSMIHSGYTYYDAWSRPTKTYKPFLYENGGSVVDFDLRLFSSNTNQYPNVYSEGLYENDHFGRPLKEAKPGENINTGHTVDYDYGLVNYLCFLCDLGLSDYEIGLLMPSNESKYVFRKVQVSDEDSKVSIEYTNALGQKVATRQIINSSDDAVTLFLYDSFGQLTKVINPEDQESDYLYNILGQLYQQETVDGGKTKYMYNRSGQVVLIQDANGAAGEYVPAQDSVMPYFRLYEYDAFGRMTRQSRVADGINVFEPMIFRLDTAESQDGMNLFSVYYKNTNASSLSYLSDFITLSSSANNTTWEYGDFNYKSWEKEMAYDDELNTANFHLHGNSLSWLNNGRDFMNGRVSHSLTYKHDTLRYNPALHQAPIEYQFYSYNADGEMKWQMKQFNPYGIRDAAKGLLSRIDYLEYDTRGNLLTQNIDIHSDMELDIQYHYQYDGRGRIKEVFANFDGDGVNGEKLASFDYDDAYGLITKTTYYQNCVNASESVDQITYAYDVRDRLTDINSKFFDYKLYYDAALPQYSGSNLNGHQNYNGNINGLKATYKFGLMNQQPSNFDEPTYYAYKYDGLSRLTSADAVAGDLADPQAVPTSVLIGDVSFTYDRIGNIKSLLRRLPGQGGNFANQQWSYSYQSGSNRLLAVNGLGATATRNYSYDAAGNLKTDNGRNINGTEYGRANLPFSVKINSKLAGYRYDASDARIYKDLVETTPSSTSANPLESQEYYLTDGGGRTVGILDLMEGSWTWYAFGQSRFAKIMPNADQQPAFFPADLNNIQAVGNTLHGPLDDQLNGYFLGGEVGYPYNVVYGTIQSGEAKLYLEDDWNQATDRLTPESYQVHSGFEVEKPFQPIRFETSSGRWSDIPFATLGREPVNGDGFPDGFDLPLDSLTYTGNPTTQVPPTSYTFFSDTALDSLSFYIHDHLGNTRVVYQPTTACEFVETQWEVNPSYELEAAVDYYPYGKTLREYVAQAPKEKYAYQGSERDSEAGEDYYYTHFRKLDVEVLRWGGVDPQASAFLTQSPYMLMNGSPTMLTDVLGDSARIKIRGSLRRELGLTRKEARNHTPDMLVKMFEQEYGMKVQVKNRWIKYVGESDYQPTNYSPSAKSQWIHILGNSQNEYKLKLYHGLSRIDIGEQQRSSVRIDFGDFNESDQSFKGSSYGTIDSEFALPVRSDNLARVMEHEWIGHGVLGLTDDYPNMRYPAVWNPATMSGETVDQVNVYRREIGVPIRTNYFGRVYKNKRSVKKKYDYMEFTDDKGRKARITW